MDDEQAYGGTLADEFMNDFEEEDEEMEEVAQAGRKPLLEDGKVASFFSLLVFTPSLAEEKKEEENAEAASGAAEGSFPPLMRETSRFQQLMEAIETTAEADYALIVNANELAADLAEHEGIMANFVKDLYSERFPELDGLVPDKLEYLRTVAAIRNDVDDMTAINLEAVLPGHTSMIVRIGASTSDGRPMSQERLDTVLRACEEAFLLEEAR